MLYYCIHTSELVKMITGMLTHRKTKVNITEKARSKKTTDLVWCCNLFLSVVNITIKIHYSVFTILLIKNEISFYVLTFIRELFK